MNRAQFHNAMGTCPLNPCECSQDRGELLARAAREEERIRRAERQEVCAWAPSMTWTDRVQDRASEIAYSRNAIVLCWTITLGAIALYFGAL